MTHAEALGLLGVAADTLPGDVRRAYLRAVKAHPPEKDPDGFARVRAAYELLGAGARAQWAAALDRLTSAQDDGAATDVADGADEASESESGEVEPVDAAQESGRRERIERALRGGSDEHALEALREGCETGNTACLVQLLLRFPGEVSPRERRAAAKSSEPFVRLAAARCYIMTRRRRQGARLICALLDEDARTGHGYVPPIDFCTDLMLRLVELRYTDEARLLQQKLRCWMDAVSALRVPHDAARLVLASEVVGLGSDISDRMQRSLAKMVLAGDPAAAPFEAEVLRVELAAKLVYFGIFEQRAPHLRRWLGLELAPMAPPRRVWQPGCGMGAAVVISLWFLLRAACASQRPDPPSEFERSHRPAAARHAVDGDGDAQPPVLRPSAEELDRWRLTTEVDAALAAGDCAKAKRLLLDQAVLITEAGLDQDALFRRHTTDLAHRVAQRCGRLPTLPPAPSASAGKFP